MGLLSSTSIRIDGNHLSSYISFNLEQSIGEHHDLELKCYAHNLEKALSGKSIDSILGSVITIEIAPLSNLSYYTSLCFKGVLTSIEEEGIYSGEGNTVVLQAQSPTILADDGPHFTSYSATSFTDIITQNFSDYDTSKLEINTSHSNLSSPIPYTVQYNESSFTFAQNLAIRYGEWMYYNGLTLVFGLDSTKAPLPLKLGRDLHRFSKKMLPCAQKFNYITNDYLTDEMHEKATSTVADSSDASLGTVTVKSEELYRKETQVWLDFTDSAASKRTLDAMVKKQKESRQGMQLRVYGVSDNPGVQIGVEIQVNNTPYRVIEVSHQNSIHGNYQNSFTAISAKVTAYPKTDITVYPKAQAQTAIVKDNNDPEGLSRIQVCLPWQTKEGLTTPWIRMVSPHGGGDKGFHFIPEIGEEVLIGFEGGNAERPYYMGSLYNSKAKAGGWKTDNNDIKAIRTRSGHTLSFSDEQEKESITISDKNGNTIVLDTSKSEITINAPKKITLSSEEIEIKGSKKIVMEGTNNVDIKSKEILVDGSTKATFKSASQVNVEAANTNIKGSAQLKMEGAMTDIDGQTTTNVKGGMLNLNCS